MNPIPEAQAAIQEEIIPFYAAKEGAVSTVSDGAVNKSKMQWSTSAGVPVVLKKIETAYLKVSEEPVKGLIKLAAVEVMAYKREKVVLGFSRLKFYERQAITRRSLVGSLDTREQVFAKLIV